MNDELLDKVEQEVGMGCGAWDMVHPRDIINAVIKHHPRIQSLTQRAEAAEAVVDMLPTTADGVPMLPGMKIWSIVGCLPGNPISEGVVGKIDKPDDYSEGLLTVYCGFDELTKDTELSPEGWYSTREAALAARSEGGV